MKVLVLKTVYSDMTAFGGFVWLSAGKVECPDWNPEPVCGGGLHGLLWGEGNQTLLNFSEGSKWLVLEVESEDIVDIDGKVKFPRCEVVYCGDMVGAAEKILSVRPGSCCPGSGRSCCYIDKIGDKYWYKDGKRHREDGPAIEYTNGNKCWLKDGKIIGKMDQQLNGLMVINIGIRMENYIGRMVRQKNMLMEIKNGGLMVLK